MIPVPWSLALPSAGLAGYLAFPATARSDIMLSFGEDDLLIQVGFYCCNVQGW